MSNELTCQGDFLNISDICLKHPDKFPENCFPKELNELSIAVGIWCTINAIIGFLGNLLTILAIPYAAKKNK